MTKSRKRMVWTKWVDPLNSNIDEVEYPGHSLPFPGQEDDAEVLYPNDQSIPHHVDYGKMHAIRPLRIISTKHGLLTLTEHTFASAYFDFWTIICNFDITQEIARIIELSYGVETINILSRYRARLGFPKALIEAGVMTTEEIKLGVEANILRLDDKMALFPEVEMALLFGEDIQNVIKDTKKKLSSSEHWVMYVLPNGAIETFSEQVKSPLLDNKITLFEETKDLVGGSVFTSG